MTANTTTDLRNGVTGELGCKAPARVASLTNITLEAEQTINGVAVVTNDIVLVTGQTDTTENGVYIVSTSTWPRAVWFDDTLDAVPGTLVLTVEGTSYSNTIWETVCADNPIDFGTSEITFAVKASGTNTGDQTITLTGNVTGSGTGSFATTIANNVVTNAKMGTMASGFFRARISGGIGNSEDLSGSQATTLLTNMVGDSGSGGEKGLAPAPAAGDAAAGKYLSASGGYSAPSLSLPGAVILYAKNSPPAGYLECNGAAISRTTYSSLFAVIGVVWGSGDGSTTFNIPDLRGEFVRGWDNGRNVDIGRVFASNQTDAFQGHYHSPLSGTSFIVGGFSSSFTGVGSSGAAATTGAPTTDGTNGTPRTTTETRPVNVALMFCIKI